MNKAKLYMLVSLGILIFSVSGSLAWIVWKSTNNAVVNLEVCAPVISFVGGSTIKGENLVPTKNKEEKALKKEINVKLNSICKEGDTAVMNIYMNLELLPKGLREETFIYELYKGDKLIKSDNFKDKGEGDTIRLVENEVVTEDKLTYTLYIYIDGSRENPLTMSGQSFRFSIYGEGTDAIYEENTISNTQNGINSNSSFLGTKITRENIESIEIVENNIIPSSENIIEKLDISTSRDGTVMLWYTDDNGDNLYEVYMGSKSGIVTANVNCPRLFGFMPNLKKLDIRRLDTSHTVTMNNMFYGLKQLEQLDLTNFNTGNVINVYEMFAYCSSLIDLDLSGFNTLKVNNMNSMFRSCSSLTNLNFNSFNTEKVINMESMFESCSSLTNLDLSHFDTSKVENMNSMFFRCTNIEKINLNGFNTESVITMDQMFRDCHKLKELNLASFNTQNAKNMNMMFYNLSSLTKLDISHFDTSKVIGMSAMFGGCSSLTELDVSHFNTSSVIDMSEMFIRCTNLKELNLQNFVTTNVTNMSGMFSSLGDTTKLNLSSFDTSNVEDMHEMFYNCGYTKLDLSNFDTTSLTNAKYMFYHCVNIKELDIRSADFSNLVDSNLMFDSVPAGAAIYVKDNIQRGYVISIYPKFTNIIPIN